jgi:hypothetical protein
MPIHVPYTDNRMFHVKLKIHGDPEKISFFNWALGDSDFDWPYRPERPGGKKIFVCDKCRGKIYKHPRFSPERIRAFAQQVNDMKSMSGKLKVKVRLFCKESTCEEKSGGVVA